LSEKTNIIKERFVLLSVCQRDLSWQIHGQIRILGSPLAA
jgi:hypothetical protein